MKKTLDYIYNTKFFNDVADNYKSNEDYHIKNTNENISVLTLMGVFKEEQGNILVVTPNLFKAQKLYDKLSGLMSSDQLSFFPQDEFITTEMLAMSSDFKLERINTIKKIINGTKSLIITNTTGYIKYLLPRYKWKNAIIQFSENQTINVRELTEKLVHLGYKREERVEKQGEFSLRGNIIDIYPLNESKPFRLDLFDEDIETIRYFDVNTQRSTVRTKAVEVFPLFEMFYDEKDLEVIKDKVEMSLDSLKFDQNSIDRIKNELNDLEQHNNIDRLSRYMSFMNLKLETISDYIDHNSTIFWNIKNIEDNYQDVVRDLADWYESTSDYPKLGFDLIKDINAIFSKKSLYLDIFGDSKKYRYETNIRAKEAVLYNNNIHMAIKDLNKYNNFTTVIIHFKTKRKLESFVELIDTKVDVKIIGVNDDILEKKINLVVAENSLSFELFNINTISLNEDNLFKQKTIKKAKYKSSMKDTKKLTSIDELKKGDYIVHYDHGIGRFLGVVTMTLGENTNDYLHIAYRGDDLLYIPIENINLIQKYIGSEGLKPKLHKLGSADWVKTKQRVRKKIKDIAEKLIKLYAAREEAKGFAFSKDTDLFTEFEADFPYTETKDQLSAITDIKNDMESTMPMDRLLCGDVGYGKTEVAIRAAFKAILDNKQVAYLAPTTVLSRQHYHTFKDRFEKYGVRVELLNRFVTKAKQKKTLHDIRTGEVHIVIGTHRILSKDMKFDDLGLLIIDEEQRFGVEHKEKIKEIKINVDVLSLSATPIPRTLQMAIMGVKSMSLLETPPENRYPIQTYVLERNDAVTRDSIQREMARKGQIFYLYNRVEDIDIVANKIQRLVPEARVVFAHGKMGRLELEDVIESFIKGEYDVLVSTTIIETGIDIPNANTLLIHDSDRLGLSQLYQIRGRVGRSDKIAYAYLMYDKNKKLTDEAIKRLKVIKEFTELGSGFKIAIRDLSIRGAGDILGTEQSGFMDSIGIDLFLEMLKDEISIQSGEKEIPEESPRQPIKVRVNKYIDTNYINNDFVKVEMHRKIALIKSVEDINALIEEFKDRFGAPNKDITLYMYEKLFEYLSVNKGIEKLRESKTNVTFVMDEKHSAEVNGEYLFMKASKITKFIRFEYKQDRLNIILETIKLDKHYLYYIVELLDAI